MINSQACDVEVFPNLFSITFVDIRDYLNAFKDCVDAKGKPIALPECLSVEEIQYRLRRIKSHVFWISDTNDSQLLPLVAYINNMAAKYITTTGEDGKIKQVPFRTDLFGYNNQDYDDTMIKFFLMNFNRFNDTKTLCYKLYEFSQKIITLQNDREQYWQDKEIELVRKYRLPYATVDLFKVFGLNSASARVTGQGKRLKIPKSLKQTSINLKWIELLDFKLPAIDDEEINAYWSKKKEYRGLTARQLNMMITNDFNRYVLPQYVEPMLTYNKNDVFIVCELVRQEPDEIKLRYSISSAFKVNLLSAARSKISKTLFVKMYSKATGLHPKDFEKKRTERTKLSFKKIIFPHIHFQTEQLQKLLEDMKKVTITRTGKDSFSTVVDFYGTKYNIATGGIHSIDSPRELRSDKDFVYVHHDYTSYYPSIMIAYCIAPEHMNQKAFDGVVENIKTTRVKAKHAKEGDPFVIPGVHNDITAQALKIVINAIYGLLGDENFCLYDRLAQMKVTINGQLMTMSLVEKLELAGIHVVSANTDGIVIKLPRRKYDEYQKICEEWNKENKMSADDEHYISYVNRDINNYYDVQENGTIEFKGQLDPKQYIKQLTKGFDMPIVRTAAFEYLEHNVPVMDTLRNCKDILNFCKTQNIGKDFEIVYDTVINGDVVTIHTQRHNRFYVSYDGVIIQKEDKVTGKRSKLAGGLPVTILNSLDDVPIEERCINYKYYYNEAYKIINPIKLGISPQQKGDKLHGISSGKLLIKKYANDYNTLFSDEDFQ